ncbi:hypothetical protein LPJ66_003592 [Kickxella alabastrina]|uniref:Uncharacterized protein n=1 Tax=Kickxella alabastrina TaxID=61397 RepID=A0ACC1IJD2_9FUNG|nr:hypothetical protein LPJ66_003592 [Kickxella alabastrina]
MAAVANAHTILLTLTINGAEKPAGQCINPYPPGDPTAPVKDPSSSDMTCGIPGKSIDAELCPVEAGSEMRLQFQNYDDPSRDDWVIDKSHKGPILVYLAPLESAGKGDVWFKIFEHGYSDGEWGTDLIRGDKEGKLTITIPTDIKPGDYLLRSEVIGLHEAYIDYAKDESNGAQYFINCAHITVSGSGTSVPQGYAIPGIYKTTDPGILFDLYDGNKNPSYTIPGPKLYVAGSSGSVTSNNDLSSTVSSSSSSPSSKKTKPTSSVAPNEDDNTLQAQGNPKAIKVVADNSTSATKNTKLDCLNKRRRRRRAIKSIV